MPILWSVVLGIGCCGCLPVQVAFAEGFHGLQHRPKIFTAAGRDIFVSHGSAVILLFLEQPDGHQLFQSVRQ